MPEIEILRQDSSYEPTEKCLLLKKFYLPFWKQELVISKNIMIYYYFHNYLLSEEGAPGWTDILTPDVTDAGPAGDAGRSK